MPASVHLGASSVKETFRRSWQSLIGILTIFAIGSIAAFPTLAEEEVDADVRMNPNVRPAFQAVTLKLDPAEAGYSGGVVIQIDISQPTDDIFLHAQDMNVQRVALRNGDGDITLHVLEQESLDDL